MVFLDSWFGCAILHSHRTDSGMEESMGWSLEWELQDEIETALACNDTVEAMFADGYEVPALVDMGEWIACGEVPAVQIAQALESHNWEPIYKAFSYAWAEAKGQRIAQEARDAEEHIALVRSL